MTLTDSICSCTPLRPAENEQDAAKRVYGVQLHHISTEPLNDFLFGNLLDSVKHCMQLDHHFVSLPLVRPSAYYISVYTMSCYCFHVCCTVVSLLAMQRHSFTFTTIYVVAITINALIKLPEITEEKSELLI